MAVAAASSPGQVVGLETAVALLNRSEPHASNWSRDAIPKLRAREEELRGLITEQARVHLGPAWTAERSRFVPGDHDAAFTWQVASLYRVVTTSPGFLESLGAFRLGVQYALQDRLDAALGVPIEVSATVDERSEALQAAPTTEGAPWERVAPVLAAIATGLGVLGFVTFVGGAILFARFQGAGIPAEEALSIVPSQTLIVIGARTLAPAILPALIVALLLYLVRLWFRQDWSSGGGKAGEGPRALARAGFVFAAVLLFTVVFARELENTRELSESARLGTGIGTAALVGFLAFKTSQFVYLVVATLVSVALAVGGLQYGQAARTDDVRPAAVIRANHTPVVGFYVAESDARVYLAEIDLPDGGAVVDQQPRLIAIQKDEITDLAIGRRMSASEAQSQALKLAEELCTMQPLAGPTAGSAAAPSTNPAAACADAPAMRSASQ